MFTLAHLARRRAGAAADRPLERQLRGNNVALRTNLHRHDHLSRVRASDARTDSRQLLIAGSRLRRVRSRHQAAAWRLLRVLFSRRCALPGRSASGRARFKRISLTQLVKKFTSCVKHRTARASALVQGPCSRPLFKALVQDLCRGLCRGLVQSAVETRGVLESIQLSVSVLSPGPIFYRTPTRLQSPSICSSRRKGRAVASCLRCCRFRASGCKRCAMLAQWP